jgi:hypothetical protein
LTLVAGYCVRNRIVEKFPSYFEDKNMKTGMLRMIQGNYPDLYNRYLRSSLWLRKKLVSDQRYVEKKFLKRYGSKPDLRNPRTYNEHVTKILLTTPTPLMVKCVDKYEVRQYVEDKAGKDLLNKLYGVFNDFKSFEEKIGELPDQFVLKATHGSHWNYICRDKAKIDMRLLKIEIDHWLKSNFYYCQRELVYRDIIPRLICEEYLEDESGCLTDYKVQCFHGQPQFFHVAYDRYSDMVYNTYDLEGNYLDVAFFKGRAKPQRKINPNLPLDQLLEYSRLLSREFDFVRVDFYYVNNRLIFSELTFTPANGFFDLPLKDNLAFGRFFSQ